MILRRIAGSLISLLALSLIASSTVLIPIESAEANDVYKPKPTLTKDFFKVEVAPTRDTYAMPTGKVTTIARGLQAPWSLAFLPDNTVLVSQRDRGYITHIDAAGKKTNLEYVAERQPCTKFCEGGLLGILLVRDNAPADKAEAEANPYVGWSLFAYFTTSKDNRLAKYSITRDELGNWSTGSEKIIFKGVPRSLKSTTHNGGRLELGPDGKIWIGIGDAGNRANSQSKKILAGSVLRLNLDGSIPEDNPYKNAIWAKGLRDTQGIAFDDYGNVWSSEFGEDTWDELNLLERGKNYGWPAVEGFNYFLTNTKNTNKRYTAPYLVWHPENAAPSGLTFHRGSLFMASLRGSRLWVIPVLGNKKLGKPVDFFVGKFGRIRDAAAAPDGSIWIITSNKDGRAGLSAGGSYVSSDRIIRVELKDLPITN